MRPPVKIFAATLFALGMVILISRLVAPASRTQARSQPESIPLPSAEASLSHSAGELSEPPQAFRPLETPPALDAVVPFLSTTDMPLPVPVGSLPAGDGRSVWENQLDQILDDGTASDAQKVERLASLIPTLPREHLAETVLHLANLTPDENFQVVADLALRTDLPEEVTEVLMVDINERPDAVRFPLLLQIARTPNHPESGEALEDLAFYLDQDFGDNWAQWQASLQSWLEENP